MNQWNTDVHSPKYDNSTRNPSSRSDYLKIVAQRDNHLVDTQTPVRSDEEFYDNLTNYSPLCYGGEGIPLFMSNVNWYYSLPCILLMDALMVLGLVVYLRNISDISNFHRKQDDSQSKLCLFVSIGALFFINFFYFLTQFMNPGIRNFSKISKEEYEAKGQFFCIRCNANRTGEMQHCPDCNICVDNLDHHCGFFNKCIAGPQIYAFYGFLASVFIGFLMLLVSLTSSVQL